MTMHFVLVGDSASASATMSASALPRPPVSRPLAFSLARWLHVVAFDELGLTLELGGDGAELDLDLAAVDVAFDLLELGTGKAGSDPLDVADDRPRLVDRPVHREFVDDLLCHRRRSSRVSMSAGDPLQGTSFTRSGSQTHHARERPRRRWSGSNATPSGGAVPDCGGRPS